MQWICAVQTDLTAVSKISILKIQKSAVNCINLAGNIPVSVELTLRIWRKHVIFYVFIFLVVEKTPENML